jgi:signal transduction histidine kinase
MASGVAHDIHNPLTVILLANEMIERTLTRGKGTPVESLETVRHYAGDIDKAADSIKKLADHLRDFSRGMVQAHERLDLYDAVADALFITQNRICKCSVTAVNRVVKGRHWTMGCPNQIEQVFVNLIANACDAMEGRPRRDLEISIEPHEADGRPYWRCCVSDTGPGVPPELRDAIFRSFFTTKPRGKGTGLGLSICGSIVREHKGEISLATGDGAGSRFLVDLPQA